MKFFAFSLLLSTYSFATLFHCPFLLLLKEKSIPLSTFYPGEKKYYYTEKQREEAKLQIKNGVLTFNKTGAPFVTYTSDEPIHVRPLQEERASLVLSEKGELLGHTVREEGKYHHSTLVGGKPVKLSIEAATDKTGKILWLSYRSGHYPHEPYRLKQFLEALEENKHSLENIRITLSDRSGIFKGRTTIPAKFFKDEVQRDWHGDDIILHYLLKTPPIDYDIEEAFIDVCYFAHNDQAITDLLKKGYPVDTIVEKFSNWVDHYIAVHPYGKARASHYMGTYVKEKQKLNPSASGWETKLLNEIVKRHPDFLEKN